MKFGECKKMQYSLYFVLKERKGAWRTSTGRRRIGVKEVKKETFKDQVPCSLLFSCTLCIMWLCDLQIVTKDNEDHLTKRYKKYIVCLWVFKTGSAFESWRSIASPPWTLTRQNSATTALAVLKSFNHASWCLLMLLDAFWFFNLIDTYWCL